VWRHDLALVGSRLYILVDNQNCSHIGIAQSLLAGIVVASKRNEEGFIKLESASKMLFYENKGLQCELIFFLVELTRNNLLTWTLFMPSLLTASLEDWKMYVEKRNDRGPVLIVITGNRGFAISSISTSFNTLNLLEAIDQQLARRAGTHVLEENLLKSVRETSRNEQIELLSAIIPCVMKAMRGY